MGQEKEKKRNTLREEGEKKVPMRVKIGIYVEWLFVAQMVEQLVRLIKILPRKRRRKFEPNWECILHHYFYSVFFAVE